MATLADTFGDRLTVLAEEAANRDAVMRLMPHADVLHFASHGNTNPRDPLASHLVLADGPLTLAEILRTPPHHGTLAFLSACKTASVADTGSEEAIQLPSAMQLAGFRHVIGTLWPVTDRISANLTRVFYRALAAHAGDASIAVSFAMAVDELRSRHPDQPYLWAGYVHIGP